MTHDHSQHSQTQDSYWAVSIQHWLLLDSHTWEKAVKKGAERRGHCVLWITFNPAHVARTTKAGQNHSLNLFWWLEHSFSSFYPHFCYSTQRFCTPWLHPLTLLPHSVGIVLWMKVPLCVWRAEWCMVWLGTNWVPRPRDSIETQATTNSKIKYINNNNFLKKYYEKEQKLTVQLEVLSFQCLLWPSLQRDDKHPPALLSTPHVPKQQTFTNLITLHT